MTLVAALKAFGHELIVGDMAVSRDDKREDLCRKVYEIAPNLVVGASGSKIAATVMIRKMVDHFKGQRASRVELEAVLDEFSTDSLRADLVGWLVEGEESTSFVWKSGFYAVDTPVISGTGDSWLRAELEKPLAYEVLQPNNLFEAAASILTKVGRAVAAEAIRHPSWNETWGFAYDIAIYNNGRFHWLDSIVYTTWEIHINATGEAELTAELPGRMKTDWTEDYTVARVMVPPLGRANAVSPAIHAQVDRETALKQVPFTLRSTWYVAHIRFVRDGAVTGTACMPLLNPPQDAPVHLVEFPDNSQRMHIDTRFWLDYYKRVTGSGTAG